MSLKSVITRAKLFETMRHEKIIRGNTIGRVSNVQRKQADFIMELTIVVVEARKKTVFIMIQTMKSSVVFAPTAILNWKTTRLGSTNHTIQFHHFDKKVSSS